MSFHGCYFIVPISELGRAQSDASLYPLNPVGRCACQ